MLAADKSTTVATEDANGKVWQCHSISMNLNDQIQNGGHQKIKNHLKFNGKMVFRSTQKYSSRSIKWRDGMKFIQRESLHENCFMRKIEMMNEERWAKQIYKAEK